MTIHRIRLGPPWEATSIEGLTHRSRRFGRPKLTDPREQVWLVCGELPGDTEVSLNGEPIGTVKAGCSFAANVTHRLAPRNEVVFVGVSADPLGPVTLEIRTDSWSALAESDHPHSSGSQER